MQIEIDVKFMHTNFGGCGLSGFGDIATFKNGQIPFRTIKNFNCIKSTQKIHASRGRLKKFMQVKFDEICMYTMCCGRGLF